jgi:hypothetical protein
MIHDHYNGEILVFSHSKVVQNSTRSFFQLHIFIILVRSKSRVPIWQLWIKLLQ